MSLGMILLAVYLILVGLAAVAGFSVSPLIVGLIALVAGIAILAEGFGWFNR